MPDSDPDHPAKTRNNKNFSDSPGFSQPEAEVGLAWYGSCIAAVICFKPHIQMKCQKKTQRKPDESELLVEKYLNELGRGTVVFEPCGNIPPDFALAESIGVEVRRFNVNYEYPNGSTKGWEEYYIRLMDGLKSLLSSIGLSVNGESWFVMVHFCHPVTSWKRLKREIQQKLIAFMKDPNRRPMIIPVTANFKLSLFRTSPNHSSFFFLPGMYDGDPVGCVVMDEIEKNLRLCIAEKEQKIASYRDRYAEWWLALVDHMHYYSCIGQEEREEFRVKIMPDIRYTFNKIILLDPQDHHRAFEI